jgi:hypothetical protein
VRLEPARDAILSRIPGIGPGRAYQLARALRDSGAIVRIGRRLYAVSERLDALLAVGFTTNPETGPDSQGRA